MTKARDLANIISGGFTESDIPALGTAKITSGTFIDARLPSTALNSNVDLTTLSASNLTSGTVATARLGSGTADATTFLRGDNTFAEAGGANTPAFFIKKSSTQALNDNATTLVTFTSEVFDTNNAFANSKFTVPSGQAGKYFFGVQPYIRDSDEQLTRTAVTFQKNGSSNGFIETQFVSKIINQNLGATTVLDLAVGDYINVGVFGDTADSGTFNVYGESDFYSYFYGYKLII